jgi:trimeric autotransporter adhesin
VTGVTLNQTGGIDFGNWALGDTTMYTLSDNSGNFYIGGPPLNVSITGPNASDFGLPQGGGCVPGSPLNECEVNITFVPSALGERTATLVTSYGDIPLSGNGVPDGVSFAISAYSVQQVTVGMSSFPTVLTVTDNGSTNVLLSSVSVTGANAGDFAVTNGATPCNSSYGYSLSPGNTCQLSVVFTPSQAGLRTATLTVTDATSGVSKSVTLTGTADPSAPAVTPYGLIFGNTAVGAVSTALTASISAPNGDPVMLSPVGDGTGPGDFLLSTGTCATQTPCQVSVTFKPSATGLRFTSYLVKDLATGTFSSLEVQGTGGVATVSLSSSSLTFAARDEGTTSIPQTVTVTNNGNEALMISGAMFIGANAGDFSIQGNTCTSSVAAGANCAISVSFSPTASGARTAILQIVSNAATSSDSVQLSGTGN